jgi:tRNA A-37 threonylcarbamoyl transferase component Bud32
MRIRVEEIFHEVADLSIEDRNRYFDEHRIDSEIRSEVVALLAFESGANVTLERDIAHLAQQVLARLEPEAMLCGAYRLGRLLGTGGMGSVYLAERVDGEVAQRVAIKLLRPGADSRRSRERFLAERQILANLSHPNIAKLLDAGHRGDGQPYLVMEYIEGTAIDVYAAELGTRLTTSLFLKVCAAVSYLHRNLVVHRDLKPANILVTAEGEPKLLDFGIAKILDLISDPAATNMPVLTPNYASPEQALGEPASTATDVYSLGAVLYKLLTGTPPHHFEEYSDRDIVAVISSGRITPPSKLVPALKGDLEIILLKALRRDAQERYTTIDQFSEDLENYLESRPIRARKSDTWYQTRKFFRRRWLPVAAVSLAIVSLSAGLAVANRQQAIAQQRFTEVRQLAHRFIELHDDVAKLPGSTKIREKMVTTALDYLHNLSRGAGNDSKLLSEIGEVYQKVGQAQGAPGQPNLGRADDALESFRKAIEFESRAAALDPAYRINLAFIRTEFAYLAMVNGHFPESNRNLDAAASVLDKLRRENPGNAELLVLAARLAGNRGDLSETEGSYSDELAFFQESARLDYEYLRRKPSNEARLRAYRATTLVAWALADNKRYEEALAALHERAPVIDTLLAAEPENPSYLRQRMAAANYEGEIYDNETGKCLSKPREAAAALGRYVEIARKLAAADPNNASARLSLASAYYKLSWPLGKIDQRQSVRTAKDGLQLFDAELAQNPRDRVLRSGRARAVRHLAYAYQRNHNPDKARAAIAEAIAAEEQIVAESPTDKRERNELMASRRVLESY